MKKIFVLILFVLCSVSGFAQDATVTKVDEFIRAEMQKQKIPGVSLAVIKDGQIVYVKGYGFANVEHQVAVKPETVFQSGSIGKQFTAAAVMMLVEEGKINLEDKIGKYFADAPETWKNITIRHLLTHTSGMGDYPRDFDLRADYTEDELYKRIKLAPLTFQPGEKWAYSNLGFVTLGILINKVSGKFYGDFLQERVFKPLGMTTARIINEADIIPNRASGYRLVKGEIKNQEWVSPTVNTTADGALYLTVYDMAKWDAALNGDKVLKKTSLEQSWTQTKLNDGKTFGYGFGWMLGEINGHRIIEHGGAWQGFKAMISRFPDDKLTVIVFANLINAHEKKLAHGVAAIYNSALAAPVARAIEDKEPKVTAFVKEFLQKTAAGQVSQEMFTTEAAAALFPDRLKQAGENLKSLGIFADIQLMERTEKDDKRIYRYRVNYRNFQDNFLMVTIGLTKDNKIAGVQLRPE
ncbi:MAG TPA: serine hydrolase domain-containing protein [Pyrinomonadaceae bacterium]|jgi:CubicO group peptidase (beta-lactamase class C family)